MSAADPADVADAVTGERFDGLVAALGMEEVRELVEEFLDTGAEQVAGLRAAVLPSVLAEGGHRLRGAAATLGLDPLVAAASAVEEHARGGDAEGARDAVALVVRRWDAAVVALRGRVA